MQSDPYSLPMTKAEVAARKPTFAPFKPSSGFKKLGPGTLGREVGKPYEYVPESDGM